MPQNLLKDGGFEANWGEKESHRCLIFPKGAEPYEKDVGNIFVPPHWVFWFRHDPGKWDQPEGRDAHKVHDTRRVKSGAKAYVYFTFFRRHDAGLYQQVQVEPGTSLRLTAWGHAWSNTNIEGHESCFERGRCSCGVGERAAFFLEGEAPPLSGDPWNDAIQNFSFYVGIDPTGGTDPLADTVVWGRGAHIYNEHAQVPAVEAVAQGNTVTVFLRSRTMWSFKHNDAYWDDVELVSTDGGEVVVPPEARLSHRPADSKVGEVVTLEARSLADLVDAHLVVRQPSGVELALEAVVVGRDGDWHTWTYATLPTGEVGTHTVAFSAAGGVEATDSFDCAPAEQPQSDVTDDEQDDLRGLPREQYERTYVLLPPDAGAAWALAVVEGVWDEHQYTMGSSADDAGIGDLAARRVIAVNPGKWPTDLLAFFEEYYPGVKYVAIEAGTPGELAQKLKEL